MNNTSYKDPSGFVYKEQGIVFRQINNIFKENYEMMKSSGLYSKLIENGFLIPHSEIEDCNKKNDEQLYKIIKPEMIDFISYPWEWSFSQLKDAALLTLNIEKICLQHQMSLKDANAFNIQFQDGKAIFIDTLSFEAYKSGSPWIAYEQFCKHFLAPLALMSYCDISLNQLLKTNIDGIPLDLACKILPARAKLNFGLLIHLYLQAKYQKKYEANTDFNLENKASLSKFGLEALIDSLISVVKSLKFPKIQTEWGEYYNNTNYNEIAKSEKHKIIKQFVETLDLQNIKKACDLGANRGDYSRILSEKGIKTVALDIDPVAVEDNYLYIKKNQEKNILPLTQNLINPTPAIGFMNKERENFSERFKVDLAMALALIHHLAISNNLPFENIAEFFAYICTNLIIEFVPKNDSKVQILLATREDIFNNYNIESFEIAFSKYFTIFDKKMIPESTRTLYLMKRN